MLLSLPNFIPIPMGVGGVSGTSLVLIGAQMLWGMPRPWLPRFARQHGFPRHSVEAFVARMSPMFARLERVCRPRWEQITRKPYSHFSGLILILLGILLALPIPFTNYPFRSAHSRLRRRPDRTRRRAARPMGGATIVSSAMVGSLSSAMVSLVTHFFG